jgi:hypothetical protein
VLAPKNVDFWISVKVLLKLRPLIMVLLIEDSRSQAGKQLNDNMLWFLLAAIHCPSWV